MQKQFIAIAVILGFATLAVLYPSLYNPTIAKPQSVRMVIHEHRFHFEKNNCIDQHLKEHLYTRLVDKELTNRGYTAFSIDAVSALDKIIIGVEHWGSSNEFARIANAAVEGIKNPPSNEFLEQERALVAYENILLSESPQTGASVTAELSDKLAPSSLSCSAAQARVNASELSRWAPGEFEVYRSEGGGQYTLLSSTRTNVSDFPNAWDALSPPLAGAIANSATFIPNALFVSYKGAADSGSTTVLLAAIYEAILDSEIKADDIRPFGKAGFVVQGDAVALASIQEHLRSAFHSAPSRTWPNSLRRAWTGVCGFPNNQLKGEAELSEERIAHTYFEFNSQGLPCETVPNLAHETSSLVVVSSLIHVPEPDTEPPSYENYIPVRLCIPEEKFEREELSIAAYALRQHLRFDVGLSLNIQFSKIENNCVKGSVFAPKANADALDELFADFRSENNSYSARYSAASIIYYCSKGNEVLCREKIERNGQENMPGLSVSKM